MTVHKKVRRGKPRWVIDIPYRHRKSGKRVRFRKDADVQTSAAAHAEERRLIAEYEAHGFIRTPADKRSQVGSFLTLRTEIFGSPPPTVIVHPIYAEMASALEHEPAADLLKDPEIAAWKFPPAEIKPYVDEIKSIRESVLVLNRVQQEERINVIVERAVGELLGGERAGAIQRRLEDIAYYMARSGRREAAGWAAAAAARLRDGADVSRIALFQALIRAQLGAVFAEEQERAREEPRLIMTPAQAMRAQQQQARPRRR